MVVNGVNLKNGDLVEYTHNKAGGGKCVKKVVINEYGAMVESPYNCAKYLSLANLDFRKI